ncbi:MAG: cytochrome b/b6 domain-containing protein [Bacillota bacterium]|jgi:formate dehydrogenase subunit gamma|nr:cytochrome b/b6 domain-containing protein [Bacillota bacterium]NLP23478.1 formate dehydrogenase [Syntrophomonadaceae bacterium]
MDNDRVLRFGGAARFAHWGHTVTFLVLLFTGLILFTPALNFLAPVFGGYVNASLVHKIMAVFFTIIPLIALAMNFKGFIEWWKDVFSFGKDDIKFLMKFPLEFFGFNVEIPPQSKFNGGEKMNSVVTTTACVFLALSGYVMWFKDAFPLVVVQWAYPIHGLCMLIATCMVCMHAYLGSFHPGSGESFWGMWKGTVRSDWAAHHHGKWYDDVTKS